MHFPIETYPIHESSTNTHLLTPKNQGLVMKWIIFLTGLLPNREPFLTGIITKHGLFELH